MPNNSPMELMLACDFPQQFSWSAYRSASSYYPGGFSVVNSSSSQVFTDLIVRINTNPSYIIAQSWKVMELQPGRRLTISGRDFTFNEALLNSLSEEPLQSTINLELIKVTAEGEHIIAHDERTVTLLDGACWNGAANMGELLPIFVRPQDSAIQHLVSDAMLRAHESRIQEYRHSSPQRIKEVVGALHAVVNELTLSITDHRGAFQHASYRIAPPQDILRGHEANSLDLSLFFAALVENLGLHPLVILYNHCALIGIWLKGNLILDSLTMTRASILRYQLQQRNLLILDPLCLSQRPAQTFEDMIKSGALKINSQHDSSFIGAYDIRLARIGRIFPLGSERGLVPLSGNNTGAKASLVQAQRLENAPILALSKEMPGLLEKATSGNCHDLANIASLADTWENSCRPITVASSFATPQERLQYNRARLLNLTPANQLLNLQETNCAVTDLLTQSSLLLRHLNANHNLHVLSIDRWENMPEAHDYKPLNEELNPQAIEASLNNGHLFIDISEDNLNNTLNHLRHTDDFERQQQGVGSVYLTFLFVRWKQGNIECKAPLFLMPLNLNLHDSHTWLIHPVSSDLWLNGNLIELLRQTFHVDVSLLRPQLGACAREGNLERAKQLLTEAFKDNDGLDWRDDMAIGSFPLGRFQIWRDIERMTPSLNTPRLQKLIAQQPDLNSTEVRATEMVDGLTLDEKYPQGSMLLPWSCDASQYEFIVHSNNGQDIVLLAPPGTGKNRTIANLICQRIGQGQKVLLVTKHRTTLRSINRLLESAGLGNFSLYMPSPRASDGFMLEQLLQAWQTKAPEVPKTALQDLPYASAYNWLKTTYSALHQQRHNGMTVHEALSRLLQEENHNDPPFVLSWPDCNAHDQYMLRDMHRLVESLAIQKSKFSGPALQALRNIIHTGWTPEWQKELKQLLVEMRDINDRLDQSINKLWSFFGNNPANNTVFGRTISLELAQLLKKCAGKPVAFALDTDASQHLDMLVRLARHADAYAQCLAQLSCPYEDQAWQQLGGRKLVERWKAAQTAWWPKSIMLKNRLIKEVKDGGAKGDPDITNDAPLFDRLFSEAQEMVEINSAIHIPQLWHGFDTSSADILALEELGSLLRNFVARFSNNPDQMLALKAHLQTHFSTHPELFLPENSIGQTIQECLDLNQAMSQKSDTLKRIAGIDIDETMNRSTDISGDIRNLFTNLLEQTDLWHDWCNMCTERQRAIDIGLAPLLQAMDSGLVSSEQAEHHFANAYYAWWVSAVIAQDERLSNFKAADVNETIAQLRKSEDDWSATIASLIANRISARIPAFDSEEPGTNWEALRSELQKKHGHKSATHLWTELPDVITTLTPCLLMSPATVSQFLSSHMEPFDVVILAEASQISVEEGLCSCARAKQVIAVGDPQQNPPLFDNCSGIEESILDKFLNNGTALRSLQHHYTSTKESLIAYANHRYYDNRIGTFPAPFIGMNGLKIAHIGGDFNRATKTNLSEAEAVVRAIVYRLTSEDTYTRNQSIGVIVLSLAQQQLIEDMLAEEISNNPQIAWAFDEEKCDSPVIVRYLENSQGEYRDVVFLCLTYGWDDYGQFAMDFGPLKKTYGSCLLNVAITRSREETVLCTNFTAHDLDLSRTQSPALADLKQFMIYAESGCNEESLAYKMEFAPDPLMDQVEAGLRSKGWQVRRHIGLSPQRIDLAVVNPDDSDHYLTCIIGDSAIYRDSLFTCERDLVYLKQIERLGWNVLRVWSIDWWSHPDSTLDKLHQALIRILRTERAQPRNK